jgi:hypothetical protein
VNHFRRHVHQEADEAQHPNTDRHLSKRIGRRWWHNVVAVKEGEARKEREA